MRICIVSRELAPFHGAGIGTYVAAMARAWRDAGHEAHVLTDDHAGFAARADHELPGITVHRVPTHPGPGHDFARCSSAIRDALGAIHARARFDAVEFPDYWAEGFAALAARAEGRDPVPGAVVSVRLHTPTRLCRELNDEPMDDRARELDAMEMACLGWADVLVSPSRALLDRARRMSPSSAPGVVVPYPFDVPSWSARGGCDPRASEGIVFVGRLERRKGPDLLIRALVPVLRGRAGASATLIGGDTMTGPDGTSMRARLRSMIPPDLEGRIRLVDHVDRSRLAEVARLARAWCLPSRWENFPNVCLEAMALGACVIGSDAGGMGEIITHEVNGMLFRSEDEAALGGALERALGDAEFAARLGAAAPARVADLCDPTAIVEQSVQALESARRRRLGARPRLLAGLVAGLLGRRPPTRTYPHPTP